MRLHFIAKDPVTPGEECPTVWVNHEEEKLIIQGWRASEETKAECLKDGTIPDYEEVVELPFRMIPAIREACDAAERSAVR